MCIHQKPQQNRTHGKLGRVFRPAPHNVLMGGCYPRRDALQKLTSEQQSQLQNKDTGAAEKFEAKQRIAEESAMQPH